MVQCLLLLALTTFQGVTSFVLPAVHPPINSNSLINNNKQIIDDIHYTSTRTFSNKRVILHVQDLSEVQGYLSTYYPEFTELISNNDELWKKLSDCDSYTIFAPTSQAFQQLGDNKMSQLNDPRNLELKMKVGMYHVIGEEVTAMELFNAGGVLCLGGELPIERGTGGGFLGGLLGGLGQGSREDGSITVGSAKVTQSIPIGTGIVHEVDGLVSPNVLWRYADQLRIPGSK